MAAEIVMPRLGWTMEEGVLAEWIKKDGDKVEVGDIIFTVESDKALQEVEAFESGILRIPPDSPPPGTTIRVGSLLGYLVQPGEEPPFEQSGASAVQKHVVTVIEPTTSTRIVTAALSSAATINGQDIPAISPRARRIAGELGVDWTMLKGSGKTGRIVERDVRAAAELHLVSQPTLSLPAAVDISPVARRAAQVLGIDLAEVVKQVGGQRITREDVERAAARMAAPAPAAIQPPSSLGETRTSIPRVRRVIAERMAHSAHTTAPVTLTTEVDATELYNLRKQVKASGRIVPSYNDLLAKLVSEALVEHPAINARFEGDEIIMSAAVHIGIAVDTERGLLVPVIRDVQAKSIRQIAQESVSLAERARSGSLSPDELRGSTFSITNLGMYEIDAFTPIINLPECAILGIGRIVPKQVVLDAETGQVAIRHMLYLSLTFDHRMIDGAPAARFLQRVKQFVEQPYLWLI